MTKDEALKLALEALEEAWYHVGTFQPTEKAIDLYDEARAAIKEALAQPKQEPKCVAVVEVFGKDWRLDFMSLPVGKHKLYAQQYTHIASTKQELVGWKLVPIEPTNEMLKAMDECSTEGYDERLYAGHAASVYMAAVDAAPVPPQRTWVHLTNEEHTELAIEWGCLSADWVFYAAAVERMVKEKNT